MEHRLHVSRVVIDPGGQEQTSDRAPLPKRFGRCDTVALHRIWKGHSTIYEALEVGLIESDGLSELARVFSK